MSNIPYPGSYTTPPAGGGWFAVCLGEACPWEDPEYHESEEDCVRACPICGADVDLVFED